MFVQLFLYNATVNSRWHLEIYFCASGLLVRIIFHVAGRTSTKIYEAQRTDLRTVALQMAMGVAKEAAELGWAMEW